MFCEFRCIFDELFSLISANFLIFLEIFVQFSFDKNRFFSFRIKKIVFLRKKALKERSKTLSNIAKISNDIHEFRENFERISQI